MSRPRSGIPIKEPGRTRTATCPTCRQPWQVPSGLWLRWKRVEARISLRQMAQHVGVSPAILSLYERDKRVPGSWAVQAYQALPLPGRTS